MGLRGDLHVLPAELLRALSADVRGNDRVARAVHEVGRGIPALDQVSGLEQAQDLQPGQRRGQAGGAEHPAQPVLGLGASLRRHDRLGRTRGKARPVLADRAAHPVVRRGRRAGYRHADQGAHPPVVLGGADDPGAEGESDQHGPLDVQLIQQVGQVAGVVGQAGPGGQPRRFAVTGQVRRDHRAAARDQRLLQVHPDLPVQAPAVHQDHRGPGTVVAVVQAATRGVPNYCRVRCRH